MTELSQHPDPILTPGDRIRQLRVSLGIRQSAVAAALGWRPSRLCSYELFGKGFSQAVEDRIVAAILELANEHPAGADPSTAPGRTPQAGGKTLADFGGDADAFFAWLGGAD